MTELTPIVPNRLSERVKVRADKQKVPADEAALALLAQSVAIAERIARIRASATSKTVDDALALLDDLDWRDRARRRRGARKARAK